MPRRLSVPHLDKRRAMDDRDYLGEPSHETDEPDLKTPEDAADRFGVRVALLVTCVGLLMAAVWLASSPSFQKCSAFDKLSDRIACYEGLRTALLQPPVR
jgi:hypothetical protein